MRTSRLIALALLFPLIGCELAPTENTLGPPRVRVVNAANGTSAVTVYLDASTQGMTTDPLAFKAGSDCVLVLDASHTFTFVQGTTTLGSVTGALERGKSYTVVLVGTPFRVVLLADIAAPPSGSNGLRFINATSAAGDVYVTATSAAPGASTKVAGNLGVLAQSNEQPAFVMRPEGDTRIRLFDVGTTTTARADLELALLPLSHLANIVFVPKSIDAEPGALQFNVCS